MTKKQLLITVACAAAITAALLLVLPRLLRLDTYKDAILAELQKQLHRQVQYSASDVRIGWGATFAFDQVIISERNSSATFLQANRLKVTVAIVPLLKKQLVIRDLQLDKPTMTITRFADGRYNISDLMEDRQGQAPLSLHRVEFHKGLVHFVDQLISRQPLTTSLSDLDLALHGLQPGKTGSLRLKSVLATGSTSGDISAHGKYSLAPNGAPLSETKLDLKLVGHHLDASHAWPYYQQFVPFKQVRGLLDMDTTIAGTITDFTSTGKIGISGLHFDYQPIFHAVLEPKELHFTYSLQVTPRKVDVRSLDLFMDGIRVRGECAINDIGSKDPHISARAVTSPMDLNKFNAYIPYGIITKDVSEYIEQRIKGGKLTLDAGKLEGHISQIVNMGVGTNYNVLNIDARIEEGIVSYGPTTPLFNTVKGRLALQGKDFILRGMSGKFGSSSFTMDGRITDYPPTPTPCTFPFNMQMTPQQPEVAWLLGKDLAKRLHFAGSAPLSLSGEGPTNSYQMSGNWKLTQATYALPDLIQKPAGVGNDINFKAAITPQQLQLASTSITMGPLMLSLAGRWPFAIPDGQTSITLGTNNFPSQDIAQLLPKLRPYQIEGGLQTSLTATGKSPYPEDLSWKGEVRLNKFGCKPTTEFKPIRGLTGALIVNGASIESHQLAAQIGTTTLTAKGRYQWGARPSWSLSFTAPRIVPDDLGFTSTETPPTIVNVQGTVTQANNQISIKHLAGQLNRTTISLRGKVQMHDIPSADLTIDSPHLSVADLLALSRLNRQTKPGSAVEKKPWLVTTSITADTAALSTIPISRLQAEAEYRDRILYLQQIEFQTCGGKINGKGRFDLGTTAPRYQVAANAKGIAVQQLLQSVGVKEKVLTGRMNLSADLTCKGSTTDDCKKSALGTVKLQIADGSINRFPILSKIFSILNVSQLLKLQLPDMVSGGMPFDDLSGSFAVSDGVVSSSNLFMASNAINLSAVGTWQLPRNELAVTVGAQPLQTIDKVVSRLPIVGWILTGKERTFITTYFEVKGQSDDPVVTAIPVKSMTKGTLDIFKRVFSLPAKLFTDTGEVLLNK